MVSVAFTVYVVVFNGETVIEFVEPRAPPFQEKLYAPLAEIVVLFPAQIGLVVPEIVVIGNEFIKTFIGVLPL